ncbi:MAG: menaquinone biosynthesis protein [Pyrinomonadaceae bacterium]
MNVSRISASSYSNTAPLIWSFLYGSNHGKVEIILDNAPARSAELLSEDRVEAALVPVIAYQYIDGVRLIPNVCVGAKERARSVCLVTKCEDLKDVRSVALDISSLTSVVLIKIIFREFLGFEPEWREENPDIDAMLSNSDAALLIGDPALVMSEQPWLAGDLIYRTFDLAELWKHYTGFGFVFAMWMTRREKCEIDFAAARDEGLAHIDEIVANYESEIRIGRGKLKEYLSENISYSIDDTMQRGLELYFELAAKNGFIDKNNPIETAAAGRNDQKDS